MKLALLELAVEGVGYAMLAAVVVAPLIIAARTKHGRFHMTIDVNTGDDDGEPGEE